VNGRLERAWRFSVPSIEEPTLIRGLRTSVTGSVDMVEGNDAVRQAILLLVATVPGERVMRPEYGCSLNRLVFSPNDDTTAGLAMHYVRRAVERWEPRVDILSLDAGRSELEPDRLDIVLEYRVRATQRTERVTIPVSLQGEGAS
jgi:uncharacterized protein